MDAGSLASTPRRRAMLLTSFALWPRTLRWSTRSPSMSRIRQRPQPEREPDAPSPTQAQPAQISHYLARYRASTGERYPAIWMRTQLWGCHVLWLWSSAGGEVWAWCLPFDSEVGGRLVFGSTKTYDDRTIIVPGFLRSRLAEHLAARTEPEEWGWCSRPPRVALCGTRTSTNVFGGRRNR